MWEHELKCAIEAGLAAKGQILDVYHHHFDVEIKDDNSPVTIADKTADKIIKDYLSKCFPTHAFLTEESEDDKSRLNNDYVWIVDPVDGTKDFIAHNDMFTTNIALAYKHRVVVGVIIVPALNEIYFASEGNGAFRVKENEEPIKIHVNDKLNDLTVLCSVFHHDKLTEDTINKHSDRIKYVKKYGSSLKAAKIACGEAEISYRMSSGTKEWDTAASQILIKEAGGLFVLPSGEEMLYNREDVYNRKGYIIVNRKENILY